MAAIGREVQFLEAVEQHGDVGQIAVARREGFDEGRVGPGEVAQVRTAAERPLLTGDDEGARAFEVEQVERVAELGEELERQRVHLRRAGQRDLGDRALCAAAAQ